METPFQLRGDIAYYSVRSCLRTLALYRSSRVLPWALLAMHLSSTLKRLPSASEAPATTTTTTPEAHSLIIGFSAG